MDKSRRFLLRMIGFLITVVLLGVVLFEQALGAFKANPALNSLILGVLLIGIIHAFRQVLILDPEARWLTAVRAERRGRAIAVRTITPKLLAPLARILTERTGRSRISPLAARSMLDAISLRLDESRDISRYFIGLLVFLGLLGTFWGLLLTINSVGEVINSLGVSGEDMVSMFTTLKTGLQKPLVGMGTAFSSSLFGLAGSLVLGFLDLQAGQAQNRFYNELEEWVASITSITAGNVSAEGEDASMPAYVQALLEQTAEAVDQLQRTLARGEDDRRALSSGMVDLAEQMAKIADQMRQRESSSGLDDASRDHIRNMDVSIKKLLEETVDSKERLITELRSEIKLLARTVAASQKENRDR